MKAADKEAQAVVKWLEYLAKNCEAKPYVKLIGDTPGLANMFRQLAARVRDGEHRR